jgi:hypothetical protein
MPRSIRACRTVGNAREGPSSVRWVTFAIVAAHISRADNVLRNDNPSHDQRVSSNLCRGGLSRCRRRMPCGRFRGRRLL